MLDDRFTARVLGGTILVFTLLVVISTLGLAPPEAKRNPAFAAAVILSALPFLVGGVVVLRRASKLPEDKD